MRDYKVTIDVPEDIRNHFHNEWQRYKDEIKWSEYISEIVNNELINIINGKKYDNESKN